MNMTNEEAINHIKNILVLDTPILPGDYIESLDMAIEALKREQWIPISSVIPEDLYLIDTYSNITMAYYQNGYWIEYLTEEIIPKTNVRAYRPLPEPYETSRQSESLF